MCFTLHLLVLRYTVNFNLPEKSVRSQNILSSILTTSHHHHRAYSIQAFRLLTRAIDLLRTPTTSDPNAVTYLTIRFHRFSLPIVAAFHCPPRSVVDILFLEHILHEGGWG